MTAHSLSCEAMVRLGTELHARLASNQSLVWARMFSQIAATSLPRLAARCAGVAESIRALSPIPITDVSLFLPVVPSEAHHLGYAGTPISFGGAVQLACLLYAIECEMGADHSVCVAIRWYRAGLRKRSQLIALEELSGKVPG